MAKEIDILKTENKVAGEKIKELENKIEDEKFNFSIIVNALDRLSEDKIKTDLKIENSNNYFKFALKAIHQIEKELRYILIREKHTNEELKKEQEKSLSYWTEIETLKAELRKCKREQESEVIDKNN
jgi:hypothetical protein